MGWVRGEWKPTEAEARVEITGGLYGEEYEEKEGQLDDVANGVLRDMAAKMRAALKQGIPEAKVVQVFLQMVDPDQPDPEPKR